MTEEKKLEPELRFPGFHEPWEEKKLGEIGDVLIGLTYSPKDIVKDGSGYLVLRSSNIKDDFLSLKDTVYVDSSLKDELKVRKNDILICARNGSKRLIGKNILIKKELNNTTFGAFMMILRSENNKFLVNILQTDLYKKQIYMNLGATINQITSTELKLMKFNIPSIQEQEKIGKFFYSIDKKLDLQRERIEELKSYKKGMMQRIFDQEIRFKDENGRDYPDWKEDTINYFIKNKYLRLIKSKDLQKFTGERVYLSTSSIVEDKIIDTEGTITYNNRPSRAQMIPLENSVWFAKMKNSLKVFLADKYSENKYILSTGFYGFLPNQVKVDSNYLKQLFLSSFFDVQKNLYSEGTSMSAIKDDHFNFIKLLIPSLQEQEKIANFLSAIDKRIELEEEKLELYEDFKKGLMQRMFV